MFDAHLNIQRGRHCPFYGAMKCVLAWWSLVKEENKIQICNSFTNEEVKVQRDMQRSTGIDKLFVQWLLEESENSRPGLGRALFWLRDRKEIIYSQRK